MQSPVKRFSTTDIWMIFLTGALVVVNVISACLFYIQWKTMNGQLDEMKQSFVAERAYVLYSRFEGWDNGEVKPGLVYKFWLNNFGRTPAILRSPTHQGCSYSLNGPIKGPINDAGTLPEGFVIPTDKPFGPFIAKLDATDEQIRLARKGTGGIYCQAMIGYADVRDTLHETRICFTYIFSTKSFYLCPEKGANYHN